MLCVHLATSSEVLRSVKDKDVKTQVSNSLSNWLFSEAVWLVDILTQSKPLGDYIMKLITVSTGSCEGKTSTMYRLGCAEYKKGMRVLVIYEDDIHISKGSEDFEKFVELTEYASNLSCMDFIKLTNPSEFFKSYDYSKCYDLVLADGLYDIKYLETIKNLLKPAKESPTVIMTLNKAH